MKFVKFIFFIFLVFIYISIIIYYFKNIQFSNNNELELDLIIPSRLSDIVIVLRHKEFYKRFLNYSKIVLIGPNIIQENLLNDTSIEIFPEDKILPKKKINDFLLQMRNLTTSRDGWYEQQFLKMGYSRFCKKNYYLIWDVDTIPIKPINLFENNHPFFDMKIEHHIPYFNAINRLIPGLKFANQSYISEHMMVKTELMKNLLDNIEKNDGIPGKLFWEKILMAIDVPYKKEKEEENTEIFSS